MNDASKIHHWSGTPVEVMTIGYEGAAIDDFIGRLVAAGVETLVDVRDLPLSRKRGFSKNQLRARIEENGLKYCHFKALGDPREGRLAARAGQHERFVEIFSRHLATPDAQAAMLELANLVDTTRACLMCFERHHRGCHRRLVVEELALIKSIAVKHIAVELPHRARGKVDCCGHN